MASNPEQSPPAIKTLRRRWWVSLPKSNQLAIFAIALWLLSIPLPGLMRPSHVSDLESMPGYAILFSGWMGALGAVFAWYANPFFLYTCWKLLRTRKSSVFSAGFSVLIATSMFLYSEIPSPDTPIRIYGYGWGSFFWYSAILIVAVAVGVRRLEQENRYQGYLSIRRDAFGLISGVLLVLWLGVSLSIGVTQKIIASETERHRLYRVVFKRGAVCTTPDYRVLATIPFAGTLQISDDSPSVLGLASPVNLVSWGIPVVRKGRFDYYRSDSSPDWHLVAGPHTTKVAAKLTAEREYRGRYVVRAFLTSADEKILAFDATWFSGIDEDPHYCPGYFPAAKPDEPPRNLLLSALVHPEGAFNPPSQQKLLFHGSEHTDLIVRKVSYLGKVQQATFTGNMGCPDDLGLRHLRYTKANPSEQVFIPPSSWGMANPQSVKLLHDELDGHGQIVFQAHDHFHFINSVHLDIEAVCSDQDVYLARAHIAGRTVIPTLDNYLYLHKKTLPHFQKAWPSDRWLKFRLPPEINTLVSGGFHIHSISETGNRLKIVLAYFSKNQNERDLVEVEAEVDNFIKDN